LHVTVLYALKTGQTTLDRDDRVASATGAPLTQAGLEAVQFAAGELADEGIGALYASPGEPAGETSRLIGMALGLKPRVRGELREIDYGLWQGLTVEDIKRRHPKVYRRWRENPAAVRPPGGETLGELDARLRGALNDIAKRSRKAAAVVVLHPVALGVARCILSGADLRTLWQQVSGALWSRHELADGVLPAPDHVDEAAHRT
jgi:broad specificity phosphatase PhoE